MCMIQKKNGAELVDIGIDDYAGWEQRSRGGKQAYAGAVAAVRVEKALQAATDLWLECSGIDYLLVELHS